MTAKPLLVRAAHLLELPPDAPDNLRIRLQEQYGLDTRRLSPLSRLVLAGALPLCPKLPAHSAVYLTVPFGSIHNFKRMWDKLREYQQPSPLDFMAQLHNAPCFIWRKPPPCMAKPLYSPPKPLPCCIFWI